MPDGKKADPAPGDGFWDGSWAVDGVTLATSDDDGESVPESAALIPGLVAFLSGSWGIRLVDSDSKTKIRKPKSEKDRADS